MTVFGLGYVYRITHIEGPPVPVGGTDRHMQRGDNIVTAEDHGGAYIHDYKDSRIYAVYYGKCMLPEDTLRGGETK